MIVWRLSLRNRPIPGSPISGAHVRGYPRTVHATSRSSRSRLRAKTPLLCVVPVFGLPLWGIYTHLPAGESCFTMLMEEPTRKADYKGSSVDHRIIDLYDEYAHPPLNRRAV